MLAFGFISVSLTPKTLLKRGGGPISIIYTDLSLVSSLHLFVPLYWLQFSVTTLLSLSLSLHWHTLETLANLSLIYLECIADMRRNASNLHWPILWPAASGDDIDEHEFRTGIGVCELEVLRERTRARKQTKAKS